MINRYTSQIAAIEEFCHHVLPIKFLCLTIDNFEHAGRRVGFQYRKVWKRFFDFGGHGAEATAVIKDYRRRIWREGMHRLIDIGD